MASLRDWREEGEEGPLPRFLRISIQSSWFVKGNHIVVVKVHQLSSEICCVYISETSESEIKTCTLRLNLHQYKVMK